MDLEEYHNKKLVIPKKEQQVGVDYNKSDYKLLIYHTSMIENVGRQFTKEETDIYKKKYDNSKNLFMKCVYFSFLQFSPHFQKYLNNYRIPSFSLFQNSIQILMEREEKLNTEYIYYFFQIFVNFGYYLNNWQEIFDKSTQLIIHMKRYKIPFIDCLIHLIRIKSKFWENLILKSELDKIIYGWIENHDGNVTLNPYKPVDRILIFYKQRGLGREANGLKSTIYKKMIIFIDDLTKKEKFDEDNTQSMMLKRYFLLQKLQVIEKYGNDQQLKNIIKLEIDRISKLIPYCTKGNVPISSRIPISEDNINGLLKRFENQSIDFVILSILKSNQFLPTEPKDEDCYSLLGLFGSEIYSSNGDIKKDNKMENPTNEKGGLDKRRKWNKYSSEFGILSFLLIKLLDRYDLNETFSKMMWLINISDLINKASKCLFSRALKYYLQNDYFGSINCLIFQIEVILENLCIKNGFSIRVISKIKERQSSYKKIISILIENNIIDKNLLTFIQWFLLDENDQIGRNYRNIIAHGISTESQIQHIYTKENAITLIILCIKLAGYGIKDSEIMKKEL